MLFNSSRRLPAIVIFLIGALCGSAQVMADVVTANITQDTTWTASGNPWIITPDPMALNPLTELQIGSAVTLTIEPGVIVEIDGPISLKVLGTLIARGTADNPITVRPRQATGRWVSIEFASNNATAAVFNNNVYQSGSILEYVNLETGGGPTLSRPPDFPSAPANGVLYLNGGRPYINQVHISDCAASGIYVLNAAGYLKIENSTIVNCHDTSANKAGGITVVDSLSSTGTIIEIRNTNVTNNSTSSPNHAGGVHIERVTTATLVGNTIAGNITPQLGGGMFLFDLAGVETNYTVQGNTIAGNIADNSGGGIAMEDANATILGNIIDDNLTTENFGGGLYIAGNSVVQVDGNAIKNNDAGSDGGGIYVNSTSATSITITNNAIFGNNTDGRGGAIFIEKDAITITNNMIADNVPDGNIAAIEINAGGTIAQNSIVRNQSDSIIAFGDPNVGTAQLSFNNNNVSQNSSVDNTIVNTATVLPSITGNNIINNGLGFYLANYAQGTMSGNNNWLGTTDQTILAFNIDGDVAYDAPATSMFTDPVPVSPPSNLTMTRSGSNVNLSWSAPPESDLAGFVVYWGTSSAPGYENSQDVGQVLSHTITGVSSSQNVYFAVTAYDSDYGLVTDDPATLINEKQTSGHESWFSVERVATATVNSGGDSGGGGVSGWGLLLLMLLTYGRRRYV